MPAASCPCFCASDLHGRPDRYRKLVAAIEAERPRAVLLAGDLLPFDRHWSGGDFLAEFLIPELRALRDRLGLEAPRLLLIPGNDDPRDREHDFVEAERQGLWEYVNERSVEVDSFLITGYCWVPPTPFLLKDWERYDVSRYVDPGCVPPEQGHRTVAIAEEEILRRTIRDDLARLSEGIDMERAVFLFHSPPHGTALDRAALDGRTVDHVPLDLHVGSVAIARFIDERQPLLSLHGHIHESTRLTGSWQQRFGRSRAFQAAHDGPELALLRFDLHDLDSATRELL